MRSRLHHTDAAVMNLVTYEQKSKNQHTHGDDPTFTSAEQKNYQHTHSPLYKAGTLRDASPPPQKKRNDVSVSLCSRKQSDLFQSALEPKHGVDFGGGKPHPRQLLGEDRFVEHHFLVQNHLVEQLLSDWLEFIFDLIWLVGLVGWLISCVLWLVGWLGYLVGISLLLSVGGLGMMITVAVMAVARAGAAVEAVMRACGSGGGAALLVGAGVGVFYLFKYRRR